MQRDKRSQRAPASTPGCPWAVRFGRPYTWTHPAAPETRERERERSTVSNPSPPPPPPKCCHRRGKASLIQAASAPAKWKQSKAEQKQFKELTDRVINFVNYFISLVICIRLYFPVALNRPMPGFHGRNSSAMAREMKSCQ